MVIPQDRGGLGMIARFGLTLWCICVVVVLGFCDRRVGTAWRHTPVIHDDPDHSPPNRSAFAFIGRSPILHCCFGKGTQISISTDPFVHAPSFSPFGLVVGLVCPRHMVDWCQCVCAVVVASLFSFARWRYSVDMWVAEGHTARWPRLCVSFVHRLAVWV